MSTTILQKQKRTARPVKKASPALSTVSVTGNQILPTAGTGACRKCSCKKYVPETNRQSASITGHQFYACANCGHDVKMHA